MRTLVDIPSAELQALAELVKRTGRPRAALIRDAIADYLERNRPPSFEDGFGLWGTRGGEDGVAYQRRLRDEW